MVKWFTNAFLASIAGAVCHAQGLTHQSGANETVALKQWEALRGPANATKPLNNTSIAAEAISPWMGSGTNLFKRQREEDENGALLCRNGVCPDKSCCGPNNICGYGPDFCEDGCQSNCDAVAMCGEYSQTGSLSCGLELCCSWGGWCGTSSVHCIGPNEHAPCNPKYGSCEMITPQSCGENSGTSNGRMVGYYQASNSRDRICNGITPSQIKTEGYTHLFFAFASIDPSSFVVKPWSDADIPLMREFTKLKGQGRDLQPWIAVGGWQLNEPEEPTFTTWHDLCADRSKRTTFIASLIQFMDEYGFEGADLDWEYPGTEERGGNLDDVDNFVDLVREMREAFGSKYGISLTLAPDYWYLRYFDVGRLQQYVDHLGFMAYDLHGFWDADVDALGSIVRGQTNIEEIANNTIPLAYAKVDPSKIDLGIAWYGRGYTLSDPSCNTLGCPFSGPSKPGKCTNSAGVLSLIEIKQMIASGEATSRLLPDIGMKELVWGDQWIGYDDEETIELKRKFANDRCYGGMMAWSVDFNSGEGSNSEPPKSSDGQCGPAHGGATCPGSGYGNCCSSSGWCGSSDGHCGSACIGGECNEGGQTTDGRCGAGFNGAFCGTWDQGTCCSSGGWCGSSDAHCGDGCQSGCDGSPDIPTNPGEGNTGNPGGGGGGGDGDDEEEEDDDDNDSEGADLCGQNTENWNSKAWNDLGLAEWFQDRVDWWAFQRWPDTEGTASVPNSIAKWLATGPAVSSAEMYWPNSCKDINLQCSLDDDDYKDQCGPQTWQRAFVLWTLHNLSRFLQHYHKTFSVTARLATSSKLSTMSTQFMVADAADSELGDSAWVGLFAGLTAGFASAVPGAGSVSAGLASGILTMAQNLMNSNFVERDPLFKNYADLEDKFDSMMTAFADQMDDYHSHLFDTRPTTAAHRNEIVELVSSGAFCEEDVGADTSDNEGIVPDDQIFAMGASLINLMWKQQKLFVLELAPGKFGDLGGGVTRFRYDPCDGKAIDNGVLKDMHYCADDGTSWFILGWDNMYADFGAGQDILDDYDLSRREIIDSSRRTQDRARGFGGLSAKDMGDSFADFAKDPSKVKNIKDMVHFSLPVCVLDSRIDLDYEVDECFGPPGPTTGNRILNFRDCFRDLVTRNCKKYQHYDDSWPYA